MPKYDRFKAYLKSTKPELIETFYLCFEITSDGRILLQSGANPPKDEYEAIISALEEFEIKER